MTSSNVLVTGVQGGAATGEVVEAEDEGVRQGDRRGDWQWASIDGVMEEKFIMVKLMMETFFSKGKNNYFLCHENYFLLFCETTILWKTPKA